MGERKVFAGAVAVDNRRRDEIFPDLHRARQIVAERERGANCRGISAAGSVRRNAFHERRGQKQFRLAIKENVHGFAPGFAAAPLRRGRRIFQMTAFDERSAAEARMNLPRHSPHFLD